MPLGLEGKAEERQGCVVFLDKLLATGSKYELSLSWTSSEVLYDIHETSWGLIKRLTFDAWWIGTVGTVLWVSGLECKLQIRIRTVLSFDQQPCSQTKQSKLEKQAVFKEGLKASLVNFTIEVHFMSTSVCSVYAFLVWLKTDRRDNIDVHLEAEAGRGDYRLIISLDQDQLIFLIACTVIHVIFVTNLAFYDQDLESLGLEQQLFWVGHERRRSRNTLSCSEHSVLFMFFVSRAGCHKNSPGFTIGY